MSDNPFASPAQNPVNSPQMGGQFQGPAKAPTAVTAITIISLILGSFGLIGVCTGIGGFFLARTMTAQFEEMAEKDPAAKMQLDIQRAQEPYMMPGMIISAFNFFVATGLLVGAIMTLMRKSFGPSLLKKCFLLAVLYCIGRLVFTLITQIMTKSAVLDAMKGGPNAELTTQIFEGTFWATLAFGVVMALVLIGFYLFSFKKFGSDEAQRYFATFN